MRQVAEIFPTERQRLYDRFADRLETAYNLSRKIVSFQANKDEPIYRWFKSKEGFSSGLVKYFLTEYSSQPGRVLDPFAGVGTTLFAAQELGWKSYGVELLGFCWNRFDRRACSWSADYNFYDPRRLLFFTKFRTVIQLGSQ